MSEVRLNAYRIMWLFVFFDLPTNTKTERRHAAQFRVGKRWFHNDAVFSLCAPLCIEGEYAGSH